MLNLFQRVCKRLKWQLIKIKLKNSDVEIQGVPNIQNADIEISPNSVLKIGPGFSMRKNSVLAVRENAMLEVGASVFINRNTIITARNDIKIGNKVTIGPNVCIYDHDHSISNRGGV